jgi:hypothetical protein
VLITYGVIAEFVNPGVNIVGTGTFVSNQIATYAEMKTFLDSGFDKLLFTLSNFVLLDVGAIQAPQRNYYSFAAISKYFDSIPSFFFFVLYFLVISIAIVKSITMKKLWKVHKNFLTTLLVWLFVLLTFYAFFNAIGSFLYSGLFLVPFVTIIFFSFAQKPRKIELFLLFLLVIATFVTNLLFIATYLA